MCFFFDTMILLWVIAPNFQPVSHSAKYRSFFEKVFNSESASIAVSSVLFSEITNVYLRQIALPLYRENYDVAITPEEYKRKYRPTEHYKDQYQIICDEIENFKDSYIFAPDPAEKFKITEAASYPKLDFNDYYYYKLCKDNGYTLVTHDQDFYLRDIPILTLNKKLHDKQFEYLQNE